MGSFVGHTFTVTEVTTSATISFDGEQTHADPTGVTAVDFLHLVVIEQRTIPSTYDVKGTVELVAIDEHGTEWTRRSNAYATDRVWRAADGRTATENPKT